MQKVIVAAALSLAMTGCNFRFGVKPYHAPTTVHATEVELALRVIQDYALTQGWALSRVDLNERVIEAVTRPYQEGPMRLRDRWIFQVDEDAISAQLRLEVWLDDENGVWEFETNVCLSYEYLRERNHLTAIVEAIPRLSGARASL